MLISPLWSTYPSTSRVSVSDVALPGCCLSALSVEFPLTMVAPAKINIASSGIPKAIKNKRPASVGGEEFVTQDEHCFVHRDLAFNNSLHLNRWP